MSATGRTEGLRLGDDEYETPLWCAHRFFERFPARSGSWLEPTAGSGAIIQAARDRNVTATWYANELRAACRPSLQTLGKGVKFRIGDFRTILQHHFDVAISNPPFVLAEEVITTCLPLAEHVIMLLRVNFLGSAEREYFFERWGLPDMYVLPDRPAFWVNKYGKVATDATEYAWMRWSYDWRTKRPLQAGKVFRLGLTPASVRKASRVEILERYRRIAA